jgi:type II secretory pathway component PulF
MASFHVEDQNKHVQMLVACLADTFRLKKNRRQVLSLAKALGEGQSHSDSRGNNNAIVDGVSELVPILVQNPPLSFEFLEARQRAAANREQLRSKLYYPIFLLILSAIAFAASAVMVIGIEGMANSFFADGYLYDNGSYRKTNGVSDLIAPMLGVAFARVILAVLATLLLAIVVVRVLGGPVVFAWFQTLIPLVGTWGRNQYCSEFLSTLGILLRLHVPLPKALRLAGMVSESHVNRLLGHAMAVETEKGADLPSVLAESNWFPSWLPDWIRLKPVAGGLGEQLAVAAGVLDELSNANARMFARVLPFLIFCGAAVVIQYTFLATLSRIANFIRDCMYW